MPVAIQLYSALVQISSQHQQTLDVREQELSRSFLPQRKTEFASGRAAARLALREMGKNSNLPILKSSSGAPLWPSGVRGSISHTARYAGAIVTSEDFLDEIGLDLEYAERDIHHGMLRHVCNPAEQRWVQKKPEFTGALFFQLFSAKEAVFKALSPALERYIGFHEVSLAPCAPTNVFRVHLSKTIERVRNTARPLYVRSYRNGEHVFSLAFSGAEAATLHEENQVLFASQLTHPLLDHRPFPMEPRI